MPQKNRRRQIRVGGSEAHDGGVEEQVTVPEPFNRPPPASRYTVDLDKAGETWGSTYSSLSDLFTTFTSLPDGRKIASATHMLGQKEDELRLIAYDDADGPAQQDISRFIAPGEIAITIKHHSPKPDDDKKERIKLQCTHIQIAVGVTVDGNAGVVTVNNPQDCQEGLFGEPSYPMIFVKPRFPKALAPSKVAQYVDNIRTWLVIANTLTKFPENNYNGGDPLATRSVGQIQMLAGKLVAALGGDADAMLWLHSSENHVYCAELAHVSLNLGIHMPLNQATLGTDAYGIVKEEVKTKKFLATNTNRYVELIDLRIAPDDLMPIADEIGFSVTEIDNDTPFGIGLAIEPFTVADIIECFVQETVPREKMGEELAPVQAEMLNRARPGLLQVVGMDVLSESDPKRQAVEQLYDQLVTVVGTKHGTYDAFREALRPLLASARKIANPRGDGTGAFMPPHCFMVRATDCIEGGPHGPHRGILDWQYVGHGLHKNLLRREAD